MTDEVLVDEVSDHICAERCATYEVRDGSGRSACTTDRALAFEIRRVLLKTGAVIAIVWDQNGMKVEE